MNRFRLTSCFVALSLLPMVAPLFAADPPPAVVLSPQDLRQLTPRAQRELQRLIQQKQQQGLAPGAQQDDGVNVNLGPLFRSNVNGGNVDVRMLGGLIHINRGGRRPAGPLNQPVVITENAPAFGPGSKYHIGISGSTLLPMPGSPPEAGTGVYIEEVGKDSPAAEGGLKKGDVIVEANGKPARTLEALTAAVDASGGKEMDLLFSRGPQYYRTKVTPVPNLAAPAEINFPDDLTITVIKSGNAPATIIAQKGDKESTVTSDKIDELDPEIKPYVMQLFGGAYAAPSEPPPPDAGSPPPAGPATGAPPPGPDLSAPKVNSTPSPVTPGVDLGKPEPLPKN